MQLAHETTFTVGHEVIRLRASLRAAIRLDRRFGGFDKIAKAILAGNLSVMSSVIRECSEYKTDIADLLDCGGSLSIEMAVDHIAGPLLDHVVTLTGVDPGAPAKPQSGEVMPFTEYHAKLFRLATGWLGWTPEAAYNATPTEITEAYKGRLELLSAVFGSGDKGEDVEAGDEDARRQLNAIGDLNNIAMVA
jgi:hypothetical protein